MKQLYKQWKNEKKQTKKNKNKKIGCSGIIYKAGYHNGSDFLLLG